MPEAALLVEQHDHVLTLRLNRPDRRNALATSLLAAIAEQLTMADGAAEIRAVIITGSDTLFAAGADINELAEATSADPIESPRYQAWAAIRGFSKPLIGTVEGWCLGAGCELALCCDIVVAGAGASFGQPETNLGIIPGAGGTATLTRLIGRARAMHMVLTGETISANQAFDAGLIASVVDPGNAYATGWALAVKIAARAPLAMAAAKASIKDASLLPEDEHLRRERRRFVELLSSDDKQEGIAAFKERRAAVWRGI
ncbi:enoyl-CoA hydratase [Sphingobium sp. AEW010]|nr:enoyl-CoA hydratase [Sphingobium sp. JAI105]PSO10052.1 2,3-dehydroadipyl-CoA hydratase [Sphingobium sp. AEW4]TWC98919.1 enoyl-CoA hydratase [Sphingobium sp. AEW010]TWD18398.1 enoyl-CoA hydratase [Sphingobium sp. AEW013]TWD21026.1 enoyl-CoA hydratase [Sphingobium sp. AEW001]